MSTNRKPVKAEIKAYVLVLENCSQYSIKLNSFLISILDFFFLYKFSSIGKIVFNNFTPIGLFLSTEVFVIGRSSVN
jgi:hypothetical protein